MPGYFARLNTIRCTLLGRAQPEVVEGGGGGAAGGLVPPPPLPVEHGHGSDSQ